MSFDTTILQGKIERIKEAFETGEFGDALVTALNTGNGLLQQRVFTENTDVQGNGFGNYVGKKTKARIQAYKDQTQNKRNKAIEGEFLTSYQRKRAQAGHQTNPKNLEFSGGLRRAIETKVEDEKTAALEFNNSQAAQIARGQEQQIANIRNGSKATTKGGGAIKIFGLNQGEKEKVVEQGSLLIKQILKR